jgi:hypothetical protein
MATVKDDRSIYINVKSPWDTQVNDILQSSKRTMEYTGDY